MIVNQPKQNNPKFLFLGLLFFFALPFVSIGQKADTAFLLTHSDSTNINHLSPSIARILRIFKLNLVSGTIYFGGNGFNYTIPIIIDPSKPYNWLGCLQMSRAGSIITFDQVIYKKDNGTLSIPFSDSIKL
jgi:hypothetical protein